MNKRLMAITILLLVALLGCKGTGSEPSESGGKKVFENRVRVLANENGMQRALPEGIVRPVGFKKINGQLRTENGVKRYRLDYEGKVEFLVDIQASAFNGFRKRKKGEVAIIARSMEFEMTEKGWRGEDGNIY